MTVIGLTGSAMAEDYLDSGESLIYLDSVMAGPGTAIDLRVFLRNYDTVGSVSIPLKYDASILSVSGVEFAGSRVDYVTNKLVLPVLTEDINGHFWVTIIAPSVAPIVPGDGLLFTIKFDVAAEAVVGSSLSVDSLFFPPGGDFSMATAGSTENILTAFAAGQITITRLNNISPTFADMTEPHVFEGAELRFEVSSSDSDGDPIELSCIEMPSGASFTDLGSGLGEMSWTPAYIGQLSSEGSPFRLVFQASDGFDAVETEVFVNVSNFNRPPQLTVNSQVNFDAGTTLNLPVTAFDPDLEAISWTVSGLPSGASFDFANPGTLSWPTSLLETGSAQIMFVAADQFGAADSAVVTASINAAILYSMALDKVSGDPGSIVDYAVSLENQAAMGSFNILFNYDPSLLTPMNVTNAATRSSDFEYFTYQLTGAVPGDMRLMGIADNGGGTLPLEVGSGPIARLQFKIAGNLAYAGYSSVVRFVFRDNLTKDDNTLTDGEGLKISQSEINYSDGFVHILSIGEIEVGDINLNGLSFEISDAIYFLNYYMNPGLYPMNPLQMANSDINGDEAYGTIADLVSLINVIVSGVSPQPKVKSEELTATYSYESTASGVRFEYQADFEVGGLLLTLEGEQLDNNRVTVSNEMTPLTYQDDNNLRVLVYSFEGRTLPAGSHQVLLIEGLTEFEVGSVSMASASGQLVNLSLEKKTNLLPDGFELSQNYPNPFNPETNISFSLGKNARVNLAVYNVLGHEVKILVDDYFSAGIHQVVWDGTNSQGQKASSGVYYYRLESEGERLSCKMLMLK